MKTMQGIAIESLSVEVLRLIVRTPITEWERTYWTPDGAPCDADQALIEEGLVRDELELPDGSSIKFESKLTSIDSWSALFNRKNALQSAAANVLAGMR